MSDVDAAKVNLEPDSVFFMEALIAQEHEAGLNGFSLADEEDRSDNLAEGGATAQRDNEKASAAEQMCPVGLHKAVLLYPASARLLRSNICTMLSNVVYLSYNSCDSAPPSTCCLPGISYMLQLNVVNTDRLSSRIYFLLCMRS